MQRFWTCHWGFQSWKPAINLEGHPLRRSGSNSYNKRGVAVGDCAYIVSIHGGHLYLGGRMTVKRIVNRAEAIRLWDTPNLFDAEEWIVDPDEEGTPLALRRRLSPNLAKQLRFKSKGGVKGLCFVSETELDGQATRGVRELAPESARLLDRILKVTDSRDWTGLLTVTEDMIPEIAEDVASTIDSQSESEEPQADEDQTNFDNHDEFGTAEDYLAAFREVQREGIPDNHLKMLRAHFDSPDHTTTWANLAKAVGYANGNAVNLHYGRLAARVAEAMGIEEVPNGFWLDVIAKWASERDAESGHTAFVLRQPVIEALMRLGVLPSDHLELLPDEVASGTAFLEGTRYQVLVNAYERNSEARRRCIEVHGTACCICGFDFGATFGSEAEGYIHVHHIRPVSEVCEEYEIDPVADLRPVCPNCHAYIHLGNRCRSVDEVRRVLQLKS